MTSFKKIDNLWYMLENDGKWYYIRTEAKQRIEEMEEDIDKMRVLCINKEWHLIEEVLDKH